MPELFRFATPEIKREIVQTCVRALTYNGETLQIKSFSAFYKMKYWKNVKNGVSNGLNFELGVNDNIIKLLYLCLHDEDTIEQVKQFLNNTIENVS